MYSQIAKTVRLILETDSRCQPWSVGALSREHKGSKTKNSKEQRTNCMITPIHRNVLSVFAFLLALLPLKLGTSRNIQQDVLASAVMQYTE